MKKLFLLRHTSPNSSSIDEKRTLSSKGKEEANLIAHYLNIHNHTIDIVICSSAVRTKETYQILSNNADIKNIIYSKQLYLASAQTIESHIHSIDDTHKTAMVIAHNPGIYEYATHLCSPTSESQHLSALMQGYEPGALSLFGFPYDSWALITKQTGLLKSCITPNDVSIAA